MQPFVTCSRLFTNIFYLQDQLFPTTFSMLHECILRVVHDFCGQEMELTVKWGVGGGYS